MKNELFIEKLCAILKKDSSWRGEFDVGDICAALTVIKSDHNLRAGDLVAISIIFGYTASDKTASLREQISIYLNEHIDDILPDLEKLPSIQSSILESSDCISCYDKILSLEFDGELIEIISYLTTHRLSKCINGFYGLTHFLIELLLTQNETFDSWLKTSSRKDLKYLIFNELLYNGEFYLLDDCFFSSSRNPYIRCLYFFAKFGSGNSIDFIFTSNFPKEDQLILSLYTLLRHQIFFGEKEYDSKFEKIKPLLDKIREFGLLDCISKDSFSGFRMSFFNRTTICILINLLEDGNLKEEMFAWLYDSIFEEDYCSISRTSILLANVIVRAVGENKKLLSDILKKYKKITEETLFPYAYNRDPENWYGNIIKQLFLTIVLVFVDAEHKASYMDNLKNARMRKHFDDALIDDIQKQLMM